MPSFKTYCKNKKPYVLPKHNVEMFGLTVKLSVLAIMGIAMNWIAMMVIYPHASSSIAVTINSLVNSYCIILSFKKYGKIKNLTEVSMFEFYEK